MHCGNCTVTVSRVLCREVYYTVSLFRRVHYPLFHCMYVRMYVLIEITFSKGNGSAVFPDGHCTSYVCALH